MLAEKLEHNQTAQPDLRFRFRGFPRLSFRGALALGFTVYLFFVPVAKHHDILAGTLAFSLSATLLGLLLWAIVVQWRLRRGLGVDIQISQDPRLLLAGCKIPISYELRGLALPPCFRLDIIPECEHGGAKIEEISLSGMHKHREVDSGLARLSSSLLFPHRGVWRSDKLRLRLIDHLGLTEARWTLPYQKPLRLAIQPAPYAVPEIPLLASYENPGDTHVSHHEPQGDPFDLKSYHPADGARKIHWKIFARRRELVSRHPERTMSPEGLALLFLYTERRDDLVCRAAFQYIDSLLDAQLQFFVGYEGMRQGDILQRKNDLEQHVQEAVWHCPASDGGQADLLHTWEQASRRMGHSPHSISLFLSETRLARDAHFVAHVQSGMGALLERNCQPHVFLIQDASTSLNSSLGHASSGPWQSLSSFFFQKDTQEDASPDLSFERLAECTRFFAEQQINCERITVHREGAWQ